MKNIRVKIHIKYNKIATFPTHSSLLPFSVTDIGSNDSRAMLCFHLSILALVFNHVARSNTHNSITMCLEESTL